MLLFCTENNRSCRSLAVLRGGKTVGEVKCDLRYFPVARPEKKEDGTVIPPPESGT